MSEEKLRTIKVDTFTEEEYEILHRLRDPNDTWHTLIMKLATAFGKDSNDEFLAELVEDYLNDGEKQDKIGEEE